MRKAWMAIAALGAAFMAFSGARAQFVDVPPCHWASVSVTRITDAKEVAPPAPTPALAVNALQQVFEGLRCGDADWASRFLEGAPNTFVEVVKAKSLQGFTIRALETRVTGDRASVRYALTVAYLQGAGAVTRTVQGTARLKTKAGVGWAVEYASLTELNLPLFPR